MLKKARLSPENIADWVMQNAIPIQINEFIFYIYIIPIIYYARRFYFDRSGFNFILYKKNNIKIKGQLYARGK